MNVIMQLLLENYDVQMDNNISAKKETIEKVFADNLDLFPRHCCWNTGT